MARGLRLYPPRGAKNPYYVVRGSHWNVKGVYQSTGTADERSAQKYLKWVQEQIESGAFRSTKSPTFAGAVISYRQAGGDRRFLDPIVRLIGDLPLEEITQAKVDEVATVLYRQATPSTRSRQVYTPISSVLHHAGVQITLRHPKGARGNARMAHLSEEQAFAFLSAAEALQPRFGALCTFLLYTGCRLSEGLRLRWDDLDLPRSIAYIRMTKNGSPRTAFLPEAAVAAIANLEKDGERLFPWWKGGPLNNKFHEAAERAGLDIPDRVAFHILRHTYGAWMRRYAGLDTSGLVATGAWKSPDAARVYEHVETSVEAQKASLLPVRKRK